MPNAIKNLGYLGTILLLAAVFIALNTAATPALVTARLDLSQGRLYTLTNASKRIARSATEPIRLRFYFSESLARENPGLLRLGRRVKELLDEYARASKGNIIIQSIDPEPFSEAEDDAVAEGLRPLQFSAGQAFYFGLVGTNSTTGREIIPGFDGMDERFLEYEVSRLIHALVQNGKPVLGLISSLPLQGLPAVQGIPPQLQQPWQINKALAELFEVQQLPTDTDTIPSNIDVLLLAHAKELSPTTLYAIDQYVLKGGALVAMVDPLCEADIPLEVMSNPSAMLTANRTSELTTLFSAWGIRVDPTTIVADRDYAQRVRSSSNQNSPAQNQVVTYIPWLALPKEALDSDHVITGQLSQINMAAAGNLESIPNTTSPTTITPLVQSSTQSQLLATKDLRFSPDPEKLLENFVPSGAKRTLAGVVTGVLPTAFPNGKPDPADTPLSPNPEPNPSHLATSNSEVSFIVITDADMLADNFWLRPRTDLFGRQVGFTRAADNADLVINALESLLGNGDLISVRARGQFSRPFTYVEKIRTQAEEQYRSDEQALQQSLFQAQQRIAELQSQRPDTNPDTNPGAMFSDEQRAEIERVQSEMVATRRQLRDVRYKLDKDIKALGTRIKVINIAVVPAIVALLAVVMGWLKLVHRRAERVRAAHEPAITTGDSA